MLPLKDIHNQKKIPYVNGLFILGMIGIFIIFVLNKDPDTFIFKWSLIPALFSAYKQYSLVLATIGLFLNTSVVQLIMSLIFLKIFGNTIEDYLGHLLYLLFYTLSGVGSALIQLVFVKHSNLPLMGSGGAISALIGLYLMVGLNNKILVWFPVKSWNQTISLPVWFMAGLWLLLSFLKDLGTISTIRYSMEPTGWISVVAGFVIGIAVGLLLRPFLTKK